MRSSFLSIIKGNWVPYYSSILQFRSTIQKYKTYEKQIVENEHVNYEWEQKAQKTADINDVDDSKNNKVEEPTEEDKKSPWAYGIYLYQSRCLALSNYLLFSCSLFRDALSSKDYSQRIKTSLFHSTPWYL
jgi:outer membrane phospholipase A